MISWECFVSIDCETENTSGEWMETKSFEERLGLVLQLQELAIKFLIFFRR